MKEVLCPSDESSSNGNAGCGQWSPEAGWTMTEVSCAECGSHEAAACPKCGEAYDATYYTLRTREVVMPETKHPEVAFLDRIANADKAKLTKPDGTPLSGLAEIAAVIYLEADYNMTRAHIGDRHQRQCHARLVALRASLSMRFD